MLDSKITPLRVVALRINGDRDDKKKYVALIKYYNSVFLSRRILRNVIVAAVVRKRETYLKV